MRYATLFALGVFTLFIASPATAAERFWFNAIGVEMGMTTVVQGTSGNESAATEDSDGIQDQFDIGWSGDLAFIGKIGKGQTLNLVLEAGQGDGAGDNVPAWTTPNYDAADTTGDAGVTTTLAQAYYEGAFMEEKLVLSFGLMDAHSLTDANEYANDETAQFLNGIFVRSVGTIFAEHENYYVPTIAVMFQPVDLVSVTATYSQNGGQDFFNEALYWVEVGIHPDLGSMKANIRAAWAMHDLPHTNIATGAEESNAGMINVSADLTIAENFGLFARFATQSDELEENEITTAISGGLSVAGALWGRDDDGLGVGYGMVTPNEKLSGGADDQTVIEAYYRLQMSDNFSLSADVQLLSGLPRDESPDVTVFGIRTQIGL